MIRIRNASERGNTQLAWLDSYHTFSFGGYHDPEQMGFRCLRVLNEDRVQPGTGFDTHSHRDMEIIGYVLSGALEHKDSMGNGSVSYPGDVQLMRAGTGVTHSEYNPSDKSVVHFLQIWILPSEKGLEPGYQQRHFRAEERRNALRLVASRDGCEGSVRVHQDAEMYTALLDEGAAVTHRLPTGRHAWLQVAVGAVRCNGIATAAGDGAAVNGETTVNIIATGPSEVIFFDLA